MQANVDNLIFNRCLFSSKLHSSKQLILWWLHGSEHPLYSSGAPNSAKFRGGCRFDKGGVTKNFEFLRDKNINFLEFLR